MTITKNKSSILKIIAMCCILLIVIISLLSAPIADVWSYINGVNSNSFLGFLSESMNHTGRLGQWGSIYIGVKIFGINIVKISPLLLFLLLSFAIFLNLKVFNLVKNRNNTIVGSVAILVAFIFIILLPSITDSLLWYDSAVSYVGSIIMALFTAAYLKSIILRGGEIRPSSCIALVFLCIISQLFSEPTSAIIIVFLLLSLLYFVSREHFSVKTKLVTIALFSSILGFAILYFSPGSINRRVASGSGFSFYNVFVESLSGYVLIFENISKSRFLATVILAYIISRFINKKQLYRKNALLVVILLFLACTYGVFAINNYAQDYIPYRMLTLPIFAISLSIVYIFGYTFSHPKITLFLSKRLATPIIHIVSLVVIALFLRNYAYIISELAVRDNLVRYRDSYVQEQIANNNEIISVPEVPNRLTGNAEDFYYYEDNGEKKLIWVAETYAKYMSVDAKRLELVQIPYY